MWSRHFLVFLLSAGVSFAATAFERPFPPNAKRGKMTPAPYPVIVINGKDRTLSAGARIWNQDNLIEMPAALRGSGIPVNYTEDGQGDIDRIWMLTDEEAASSSPK